jgi:hypothetical protein
MDEDCEDACDNEEAEVPRAADNNNSKRYWCAIDGLAEVQKLCLKRFEAHHKAWNTCNKRYSDLAMAQHYRLTNMEMALYLFIIYPKLYNQAMSALWAAGKQYPNPLTSVYGCTATNPKFITILRQHLCKPKPWIHVESNPLEGASCYNPGPSIFHF